VSTGAVEGLGTHRHAGAQHRPRDVRCGGRDAAAHGDRHGRVIVLAVFVNEPRESPGLTGAHADHLARAPARRQQPTSKAGLQTASTLRVALPIALPLAVTHPSPVASAPEQPHTGRREQDVRRGGPSIGGCEEIMAGGQAHGVTSIGQRLRTAPFPIRPRDGPFRSRFAETVKQGPALGARGHRRNCAESYAPPPPPRSACVPVTYRSTRRRRQRSHHRRHGTDRFAPVSVLIAETSPERR
jgi:hypothetical protein